MLIGDIDVHPVADGTFRASPAYFGAHARPDGHEDVFSRQGMAWLPIGCFLVRTSDAVILVDAGMGPAMRDDGPERLLVGGQLLVGLRAVGVSPADVDQVICTHLHADHCGWLFDLDGRPVFANATIWFGAPDWDHFVVSPDARMADHIRHGFRVAGGGRLRPVASATTVARGLDVMMAPGHTPGHLCVVVSSGRPGDPARRRHRLSRPAGRAQLALDRRRRPGPGPTRPGASLPGAGGRGHPRRRRPLSRAALRPGPHGTGPALAGLTPGLGVGRPGPGSPRPAGRRVR